MKRKRYSVEQIIAAVKQNELGTLNHPGFTGDSNL